MIVGILSDSHGQTERTATAIRLLQHAGAEAFVHCGDVGGLEVLDTLAGLNAWIACGNVDCPDAAKIAYAQSLGLRINHEPPVRFTLDGTRFAVFHGHERGFERLLAHLRAQGDWPPDFAPCDYLLHGHTHVVADTRVGPLRIVNPGALHRALTHTVATLDTRQDRVLFWPVEDGEADPARVRALRATEVR